jgi:hypothetical protein
MAYMVLDTTTNIMWHYKKATSNAWLRVGGSITSGLTGVLPVANGGTNTTTLTANKVMVGNGTSGVLTPTNLHWDNSNTRLGIGTSSPSAPFTINSDAAGGVSGNVTNSVYPMRLINSPTSGSGSYNVFDLRMARGGVTNRNPSFSFSTDNTDGDFYNLCQIGAIADIASGNNIAGNLIFTTKPNGSTITERMRITSTGNVGIGTTTPAVQFHTTSNVRFAGLVNYDPVETDADGDIIDGGASDFNLKNSIEPINYGLNSINQLKPVSYLWNDVNRKLDSTIPDIGFIAQDVMDVIPEAVRSNGDGDLQLNYKAITATLVKAIQEQQALIKALEQRIINLENK